LGFLLGFVQRKVEQFDRRVLVICERFDGLLRILGPAAACDILLRQPR
jgi:hypothetical protein